MDSYEQILNHRYEVVVIGAGVGGLSAAAMLAHEGIEVLVIERAGIPGGACSSFRSGDFSFDVGAFLLQGFGPIGFHVSRSLFDFLGQQVEILPCESAYRMYLGDEKIDFHLDRHALTSELGALFPEQAGGLLSFVRELDHIYHHLMVCSGPPKPRSDRSPVDNLAMMMRHPLSVAYCSRYARTSAERVFSRHLDDQRARAFFDADLTYATGYRLSEISVAHAALSITDRMAGGAYYPIGSSQQIPDRIEKSIIEHGGRIVYGLAVEEVLVEEGAATGVRLSDGRTIGAEAVVSDVGIEQLLGGLVPTGHLREQTREWLGMLKATRGTFSLFLKVDEALLPEDLQPNTVILEDPVRRPADLITISVPSLLDPNLAPEGAHAVRVQAAPAARWPGPGDDSYGTHEYEELKATEAAALLARLEPHLPGAAGLAEGAIVASPSTFERYTGRPLGSPSGPWLEGALMPADLPGATGEITGLFMTGDSTFYGSGVALVVASGINCGQTALRFLGLRAPKFHPVKESFVLQTVPVRPQISRTEVVDAISAVLESHRCLRCEDAPCRAACPAGVDIPTFVRRVSASDFSGAAQAIRESNPFGEVCGILCPKERFCEGSCARRELDTPIQIGMLEALSCSYAPGPEGWPAPYRETRHERVAVVGSGPAGVSCAYFLSRLGHRVEIFESALEAGGLPVQAIPRLRLGRQVMEREMEGALAVGVEFRGNTAFGEDINFDYLWREGFGAVFVAAGLQATALPDIPGAELPGTIDALSFLQSASRGVKRELTDRAAVLGDDSTAVDSARLAREMGCETVFLVTPTAAGDLRVPAEDTAAAVEQGVVFLTGRMAAQITGEGRVEALRTTPTGSVSPPVPVPEGEEPTNMLDVGTVIIAGRRMIDPILSAYLAGHLKTNPDGTIDVDESTMMSSRPGVFAGGDIVGGAGLVVEACAHGRKAALAIDRYLRSVFSPTPHT